MSDFLNEKTESFSSYLSEQYPLIKKHNGGILSYAVEIPDDKIAFQPDAIIGRFNTAFYYEKPEQGFLLFSAEPVFEITENGEGRFAVIDKKIRDLKKIFFSNWDKFNTGSFPLFTGGMKFAVEHSDADWKEFNDSNWFIPEITLLKMSGRLFFLYNAVIPFPREQVIKKFNQKLSLFLNQSPDLLDFPVRLSQLNGNSPKEKKKWKALAASAIDKISAGELSKIVLSRMVELKLFDELSFNFVLERFRSKFPNCTLFIYKRNRSVFFGATPERLANFNKTRVEFDALAGSKPRGNNAEEDLKLEKELFSDEKILLEHAFVVKHLNNTISRHLNEIVTGESSALKLENIQHILTKVSGKLKDENCMFNLVKEIFPTPAICGYPKEKAMQIIKKTEDHLRGLYSGIIGWYNLNGTGEFNIAIRSALYSNKRLLAYAGAGIIESSNPDDEFRETELKLQSIISLFDENKN